MKLTDIAERLGCTVVGDGEIDITGAAGMEVATPSELTFLANPRYGPKVKLSRAGAILVKEPIEGV